MEKPTCRLCLVFDPSKSLHYKVVCFRRKSPLYWVETYDSETNTWEKGPKIPYMPTMFHNVIYWNEVIYYIRIYGASQRFILDDKFYEVPSPSLIYDQLSKESYVMESNGHMHCVSLPYRPDKDPLVLLEMDKMNLTWSKKCRSVVFHDFSSSFYESGRAVDVLGLIRGEKEQDSELLFGLPGKIMTYNFLYKTFEEVATTGEESIKFLGSHQFVETLVPV